MRLIVSSFAFRQYRIIQVCGLCSKLTEYYSSKPCALHCAVLPIEKSVSNI